MPVTEIGTIQRVELHPLQVISSGDYDDFFQMLRGAIPTTAIDAVAAQVFLKLHQVGLTLTMPTEKGIRDWHERVADHQYGQLVLDVRLDYDSGPMYGGFVITYQRGEDIPRGWKVSASFHT